jgi:hypothetical protein
MPRVVRRGSKYSKRKPQSSKKTYSNYGKAAKAKRTSVARAATAKPTTKRGAKTVQALAVSNARSIARLQDAKYGPLQRNSSYMPAISGTGGSIHVTKDYPVCLHLNSLYSGQTGEPKNKWIQSNTIVLGSHQPVMDDYNLINHPFEPLRSIMVDNSDYMPRPNGPRILWKSTTLKFEFNAWVPETYVDIYIVQQRVGKHLPDPWDTIIDTNTPHGHQYLPYTLPQWRNIGSKPMSGNWIDRSQYKILAHRKLYMDSVGDVPPTGFFHNTADAMLDATVVQDNGRAAHATKNATTNPVKWCSITIKPNMVVKQLKTATDNLGEENMGFNANPQEEKTDGPWSYDNIDPRQNIWAIVTTSDPGHDQLDPSHKVRFRCERWNTWRDLNDTNRPLHTN